MSIFRLGVSAQIGHVQTQVETAASLTAQRFRAYEASFPQEPSSFATEDHRRELTLILQLVLADFKEVEGGFWSARDGFLAYAYPSYGRFSKHSLKNIHPRCYRTSIALFVSYFRSRIDAARTSTTSFWSYSPPHSSPCGQGSSLWKLDDRRAAAAWLPHQRRNSVSIAAWHAAPGLFERENCALQRPDAPRLSSHREGPSRFGRLQTENPRTF